MFELNLKNAIDFGQAWSFVRLLIWNYIIYVKWALVDNGFDFFFHRLQKSDCSREVNSYLSKTVSHSSIWFCVIIRGQILVSSWILVMIQNQIGAIYHHFGKIAKFVKIQFLKSFLLHQCAWSQIVYRDFCRMKLRIFRLLPPTWNSAWLIVRSLSRRQSLAVFWMHWNDRFYKSPDDQVIILWLRNHAFPRGQDL